MYDNIQRLMKKIEKTLDPINRVSKNINRLSNSWFKSTNHQFQNSKVNLLTQSIERTMRPFNEIGKKIDEITKPLAQLVNAHSSTFEKLARIANEYQKRKKYIDKVMIDLDSPDFKIISENIISLTDICMAIDLNSDPDNFSIFAILSSDDFHMSLLDFYSTLGLEEKRSAIISEALLLHKSALYCGSTCLLYSLLEGVLTEYLVESGHVVLKKGKFLYVNKRGKIELKGLSKKLECIKTIPSLSKADIEILEKLDSFQFIFNNKESTVVKTRNSVMHGSCIDFNEKQSGQLILWLFSLLTRLKVLKELISK